MSNNLSGINVQIVSEDVSFELSKLDNTLVYADTSELFHGASWWPFGELSEWPELRTQTSAFSLDGLCSYKEDEKDSPRR